MFVFRHCKQLFDEDGYPSVQYWTMSIFLICNSFEAADCVFDMKIINVFFNPQKYSPLLQQTSAVLLNLLHVPWSPEDPVTIVRDLLEIHHV